MRVTKGETLQVRVPTDLAARVDAIAEAEGVSRSEVVRRSIEAFSGSMVDQLCATDPNVAASIAGLMFASRFGNRASIPGFLRQVIEHGKAYAPLLIDAGSPEAAAHLQCEILSICEVMRRKGGDGAAELIADGRASFTPEANALFDAECSARPEAPVTEGADRG